MRYRLQSFLSTNNETAQESLGGIPSYASSMHPEEDSNFLASGRSLAHAANATFEAFASNSMRSNNHVFSQSPGVTVSGGWWSATVHAPQSGSSSFSTNRIITGRRSRLSTDSGLSTSLCPLGDRSGQFSEKTMFGKPASPFDYSSFVQPPKNDFRRTNTPLALTFMNGNSVACNKASRDDDEQSVYELLSLKSLRPPLEEISQKKSSSNITEIVGEDSDADIISQRKQQIAHLEQENAKLRERNRSSLSSLLLQVLFTIIFVVIYFTVQPYVKKLYDTYHENQ